ncbi:MAG: TonB-dependent receptor [Saprospiraceae bacterium]
MKNLLILFVLFLSTNAFAQFSIMGNISDENGNSLPGATILLSEMDRGAFSDSDGFFIFTNLPRGKYTLEISYVGFADWKKTIDLSKKEVLDIVLKEETTSMPDVEVLATWADERTPMTYTNYDKEEIERLNIGQDAPYVLKWTPSTVVTSDAGAGIGYTGIRIRGSDPTRINVTINGIPLNDSESQGTFWVNLPDFLTSTQQVQIQRGVGTSTNGAGAFGATVALNTASVDPNPYITLGGSIGSFNTWKNNVQFGSGLLADKFVINGRASYIHSDGYIDRAEADLRSGFLSAAYLGDNQSLRLNVMLGQERTYQAWNGVSAKELENDETRNNNSAGTEKTIEKGGPHDNEVDNYEQNHFQLLYDRKLSDHLKLDVALHYTKGSGYFEQYKADQFLAAYFLSPFETMDSTYTDSDLVRRRWLDNDFYGTTFSLNYKKDAIDFTFGGAANNYTGRHFGEVIEGEFVNENEIGTIYYDNDAEKLDINAFAKVNYALSSKLNAYFDMQHRFINYEFLGVNADGESVEQDIQLNFFNPKLGLFYQLDKENQFYASHAIANREPNRDDYTESPASNRPDPETLYNTEIGYRMTNSKMSFGANIYHMHYQDQLVLTGEINDVGAATRVNVPSSYRLGLELDGQAEIISGLTLMGNATLSRNKINSFTEFIDNYTTAEFSQTQVERKNTDIAFSPALIASLGFNYAILNNVANKHHLDIGLQAKYIGEQYIDNSQDDNNKLDAFLYADFRMAYNFKYRASRQMALTLLVNNVFNNLYESNAWSYRFISTDDNGAEQQFVDQGFFPQAGINFLLGIEIAF